MERENAKLPICTRFWCVMNFEGCLRLSVGIRMFVRFGRSRMIRCLRMFLVVLAKLYCIVLCRRGFWGLCLWLRRVVLIFGWMDQWKIIIVDLPEGVVTFDVANFWWCWLISFWLLCFMVFVCCLFCIV